jgi:hypothetical protein
LGNLVSGQNLDLKIPGGNQAFGGENKVQFYSFQGTLLEHCYKYYYSAEGR